MSQAITVNMDKPDMDRPILSNPLPTPEEPIFDSFKAFDQTEIKRPKSTSLPIAYPSVNQENESIPSSSLKRKRSYEDAAGHEQPDDGHIMLDQAGPMQDFVMVDPEIDDGECSQSDVALFTPRMPAGQPRSGLVERQYSLNPRQYLLGLISEVSKVKAEVRQVNEAKRKAEAIKKAKEKATSRHRATLANDSPPTKQRPLTSSPVVEVVDPVTPPHRPTRTRAITPAVSKTPKVLATPPPTTPRRISNGRKKVKATPKADGPPSKKQKKGPGLVDIRQNAIKSTLNKRWEVLGMNTNQGKGQYKLFEDAYIPPIDLDIVPDAGPCKREGAQLKELSKDDPVMDQLHPKEFEVAEWMRASAGEYLCQKRRFFLGLAQWWQFGYTECKPAHVQWFCNQDGNSSSYMHSVYKKWGWLDRALYSDELIAGLPLLVESKAVNPDAA